MAISEVNAVLDLVSKAASFYTQARDGWYKGSSEVDDFGDKVLMLSAKLSQWSEQVRRYGISEDKHLLLVVKLAEQALEKQEQSRRKLERSPFRRFQKRVFSGEISFLLDKLLQIVDAPPQFIATRLANNDLLERYLAQNPPPLPFGPDKNYVPIVSSIVEVQSALESPEADRVVVVHGGPGMGKSCLVKHLAIHYVEEKKMLQMDASSQKSAVFPDGVFYLLCGQQADKRIKQLQLELLQSLGFEGAATAPDDPATSSGAQADYTPILSLQMKLRSRLAEQKLLVILDDLWEETVLQEVLVPAKGVKYLITSQRRDIFFPAKKIQITSPTAVEARSIMANYTEGLPIPGQFPPNIQTVADDIIQRLEHHPLSLANIGVSINSSRATHTDQWEVIRDNLYVHLDENDLHRPPAYDRAYGLPVGASMMLMVDSLPADAQVLLFLMTLLGGQQLPEPLVKLFYRRVYRLIPKTSFAVKYNRQEKFLEDKSLIETFFEGENRSRLDIHSLRSRYIRDRKTDDVRSLGSQILVASGSQAVAMPIQNGDTDETLLVVLGGIYYDPVFQDIIRSTCETHMKLLNGGDIPQSLNMLTDTTARDYVKKKTEKLIWVLDVDHEEGIWKKQAHEYAKKIIIKYACQGKLEDGSMAGLLKHHQTTSVACSALSVMRYCHETDFRAHNITFSSVYPEIMKALLALLQDKEISSKQRATVMSTLADILDFESKDTILKVGAQYRASLAMDSKPEGQAAMMDCLRRRSDRGYRILTGSAGLLEDLLGVLFFGKDHRVRQSAAQSIQSMLKFSSRLTSRVAAFPNALQLLFDAFVSQDILVAQDPLQEIAGQILASVTSLQENISKFVDIQGVWEGLGAILVKLEGAWRKARGHNLGHLDRFKNPMDERGSYAAWIIGNLALEKDVRDTIAALPGVQEGLLFLQTAALSRVEAPSRKHPGKSCSFTYTRALTILYPNANLGIISLADLKPLEEVLEVTISAEFDGSADSLEGSSSVLKLCRLGMYWSQSLAYIRMGWYIEALSSLDRAERHLDNLAPDQGLPIPFYDNDQLSPANLMNKADVRACKVFLQAMLKDYPGAIQTASMSKYFPHMGVLKRLSGDVQGALDELINIRVAGFGEQGIWTADALKQRGYVKYLMDDEAGARKDAEMAQEIEMEENEWGEYIPFVLRLNLWDFNKLPVSYLEFSF